MPNQHTPEPKAPLMLRGPDEIILTQADLNTCLGSGELLPCPHCGAAAMSSGERTENKKAIRWTIQCTGSKGLWPNCHASVIGVDPDQDTARAQAVERWNKRTLPETLKAVREALSFYMGICGNTGHSTLRESFQEAYEKGKAALALLPATTEAQKS